MSNPSVPPTARDRLAQLLRDAVEFEARPLGGYVCPWDEMTASEQGQLLAQAHWLLARGVVVGPLPPSQTALRLRKVMLGEVKSIERFIKKSHPQPAEVMAKLLEVEQCLVDALEWPDTNDLPLEGRADFPLRGV